MSLSALSSDSWHAPVPSSDDSQLKILSRPWLPWRNLCSLHHGTPFSLLDYPSLTVPDLGFHLSRDIHLCQLSDSLLLMLISVIAPALGALFLPPPETDE